MNDLGYYYKRYSAMSSAKMIFNLMQVDMRNAEEDGAPEPNAIRLAAGDIISSRFGISMDEVEKLYK